MPDGSWYIIFLFRVLELTTNSSITYDMSNHVNRYGNWGVCFTYGSWFALGGLVAAGKSYNNSAAVRKGVEFLLRTQRSDGGWGESYRSCPDKVK